MAGKKKKKIRLPRNAPYLEYPQPLSPNTLKLNASPEPMAQEQVNPWCSRP